MPSGRVNDRFSLNLDAHDSKTKSCPNDPPGGSQVATSPACRHQLRQRRRAQAHGRRSSRSTTACRSPSAHSSRRSRRGSGTNGTVNPDFTENEARLADAARLVQEQETEMKEGRSTAHWNSTTAASSFGVDYSQDRNATRKNELWHGGAGQLERERCRRNARHGGPAAAVQHDGAVQ